MVELDFQKLELPVAIEKIAGNLQPLLPKSKPPPTKIGSGVQGYLFHLPPEAGSLLLAEINGLATEHLVETSAQKINTSIKKLDIPETEKVALSKSRNGQRSFRDNLLAY